ncbi:MAG: hypothetical protein RIF46_07330, partial [Cyclobacteriaceae bacterium]
MLESMPRKPAFTDLDFTKNSQAFEELQAEHQRTGIGADTLSKLNGKPASLNRSRISNILKGFIKYPSRSEYDFLMKAYLCFPSVFLVKLTPQKLNTLEKLIKEKGIKKAHIAKSLPRYMNFNVAILHKWFSRDIQHAKKEVLDAVMKYAEEYEPPKKVKITDEPEPPRMVRIPPEFLQKLEREITRTNFQSQDLLKRFKIYHINDAMIRDLRAGKLTKARPKNLSL